MSSHLGERIHDEVVALEGGLAEDPHGRLDRVGDRHGGAVPVIVTEGPENLRHIACQGSRHRVSSFLAARGVPYLSQ